MADLAVVTVSWNVHELLRTCLTSLLADLERSGLDAEVWVVDNASSDGTPDAVGTEFPAIHLIAGSENVGFAAGNNLALRQILESQPRCPFVWLLNPDTKVLPGATQTLLQCLARQRKAGIVGAKLLYADGALQHGAFRFPGLTQLAFELFALPPRLYDTVLNGRYPSRRYARTTPFRIDHPLGAAMMVRTEAVVQVGLLDEGYRMYCEEIDWCWRMHQAGWQALCAPSAEVVHHAGRSSAQAPVSSFVALWTSRARLYARYHGTVAWAAARATVRAGMRLRMRGAPAAKVAACQDVLRAWETAR